jgi:hypothetical protein
MAAIRAATFQASKLAVADDPVGWAKIALPKITFWSKQVEIMNAVDQYDRVAVRACHDSSKSFTASVIAARWVDIHPVGTARVITTAPTATQVRGILWVEINQLHEAAKLPGRVNQTEWWIGSYLAGIGRKPADYRPEAFQGMHARYPLIIIDEASGVPTSIIDAVETLATNVNAKILMIGNPDDPTSVFADIHRDPDKYGYHTIKISAWDTPNFTNETVTDLLSEVLLSKAWVENRRKAWGEDHPFWLSKVEAEFPAIDTQSTIKLPDVLAAHIPFDERVFTATTTAAPGDGHAPGDEGGGIDVHATSSNAAGAINASRMPVGDSIAMSAGNATRQSQRVMGVDVAGSEDGDETVCRLILPQPHGDGRVVTSEWRSRSSDPEIVATNIVDAIVIARPHKVVIDSIGVGFGIIGLVKQDKRLLAIKPTPVVIGFNGASSPHDKTQYGNARAELWWETRLLFQKGKIDTSLAENRDDLDAQLVTPRYHITKGKIYVESKDDINARLGRSPDNADAFMYAIHATISATTLTIATPKGEQIAAPTAMVTTGQRMRGSTNGSMFGRMPTRRAG